MVECSNCGAGLEAWVALIVAVLSLVVAVVAALYAAESADLADRATALAWEEVDMARKEHAEFLQQLQARARFQLSVRPIDTTPENGVIYVGESVAKIRVEIKLKNVGNRAASETVLNVIGPRSLNVFRWSGPGSVAILAQRGGPAFPTDEELTDHEGHVLSAQYLAEIIPRVTRRSHYVRWVVLMVEIPPGGASVPLRVTAEADELPDDEDEASERLMIRVARRTQP